MKPLTQKQIKAVWIIAAILVAIHFAPSVLHTMFSGSAAAHRQPAPGPARASLPLPSAAVPAAPKLAVLPPQAQALLGTWQGSQISQDDDQCKIHLELRASPDQPGHVAGYEARSCFSVDKFTLGETHKGGLADAMREAAPVATTMTGSFEDGAIAFQVDNTVGSSPFVCPLASYAVVPFGEKAVVAQWRAVDCPAGQMVLTRVGG